MFLFLLIPFGANGGIIVSKLKWLLALQLISATSFADIVVDLKSDRTQAASGVEINFLAKVKSTGGIVDSFTWDFGDGTIVNSKTSKMPHQFLAVGSYKVSVVAQSGLESGTSDEVIEVLADVPPTATFYQSLANIVVGDFVNFTSQALAGDQGIERLSWRLNVNPEVVSEGAFFSYVFLIPGVYEISHKAEDKLGASSVLKRKLVVLGVNQLPNVQFVNPPEVAEVGDVVPFSVRASDPDGIIKKIFWSVGGRSEIETNKQSFEATFRKKGVYTINVRVVDDRGGEAKVSQRIQVRDLSISPTIKLRASHEANSVDQPMLFIGKIKGQQTKLINVIWDFGDNTIDNTTELIHEHRFSKTGQYKILATVNFEGGLSAVDSVVVNVTAHKPLNFAPPQQVVINDFNYQEIVAGQTITLDYGVYDNGSSSTCGTASWTQSNSHVTLVAQGTCYAQFTGATPGKTEIYVTANGTQSQTIIVNVLDITATTVAMFKGSFVGTRTPLVCFAAAESGSSQWQISDEYTAVTRWASVFFSGVAEICDTIALPNHSTRMALSAHQYGGTLNYASTRTGLQTFFGRGGYLLIDQAIISLPIDFKDDRYLKLDKDFSVTYWNYADTNGNSSGLYFGGDVKWEFLYNGGLLIHGIGGNSLYSSPRDSSYYGQWHHVAVTFLASTRSMSFYEDGNLLTVFSIPTTGTSGDQTMHIVPSTTSGIDELRFWGKRLTASDVASELFQPVRPDSPDLLAEFSFDGGYQEKMYADNGSGWSITSAGNGKNGEPRVAFEPSALVDQTFIAGQRTHVSAKVPYQEFGRANFEVTVVPGGLDQNQRLTIETSTCILGCTNAAFTIPGYSRFSPFYHVGRIDHFEPHPILLKLPFDPRAVGSGQSSLIKVVHFDFGSYDVLEPKEVNLTEGFVKVEIGGAVANGDYWVGIPLSHSSRVAQYSNADLLPTFDSYAGARSYWASVPSATTSYVVTSSSSPSSGTYYISAVVCNGVFNSGSTFPLTLTLSTITNYTICDVTYQHLNSSNPDHYFSYDRLIILRGP
jgi:hypothetical protein